MFEVRVGSMITVLGGTVTLKVSIGRDTVTGEGVALGAAVAVGMAVAVAVAVTVAVAVAVTVAVAVAVAEGVGVAAGLVMVMLPSFCAGVMLFRLPSLKIKSLGGSDQRSEVALPAVLLTRSILNSNSVPLPDNTLESFAKADTRRVLIVPVPRTFPETLQLPPVRPDF